MTTTKQASGEQTTTLTPGKNDFFWSNKMECHAARKKAMLQKYGKKINELMTYEWKTKWICLFVVAVHLSSAIYAITQPSWLVYFAILYVIGGTCAHHLFLAIHEVTHYTAFKTKVFNDALAVFCNVPIPIPYAMHFKEYHYEHHRYMGWDGVDTDLPTDFEAKLFNTFLGKLFFLQFQVVFYAVRPMYVRPIPYNNARIANVLVIASTDLLMFYFFGVSIFVYLLLAMVAGAGISPFAGHFISEHYLLEANERASLSKLETVETHSYYGWLNLFAWNVGLHNEHHDFPNVPWSKLRELHAAAPEFYEKTPVTTSWFGAQMKFLFDPNVSQWCRVLRERNAGSRSSLIPTTPDALPQ